MTEQSKEAREARLARRQGQAGYRLSRLWSAAELRRVPLRTIIAAVVTVVIFYLAGKVIYRLKDVLLLLVVAGFLALILNPVVHVTEKYVVKRRGLAVTAVAVLLLLVFAGLSVAFGYPLVNGITHLATNLPSYVTNAEQGKGWVGKLVKHYHVQAWVAKNESKLVSAAQSIGAPALAVGKAAGSLLIELITIFILVLLLLLEGPKMRRWILGQLTEDRAATVTRVAREVQQSAVGYMLGNFLTSIIAGTVIFVTLLSVGVPYPLLWGLWVALVDFLPMIGGALAGIPTVLFAFVVGGLTAGIVTLVVFLVYTQVENHILNPVIMSRTVKINPLLVLMAVLIGASLGSLVGGIFGGFVAALLAIPVAGALQVLVREAWTATAPKSAAARSEDQTAAGPHKEPFPIVPDVREHDS